MNQVFVYGTLKRGQCRVSLWPTSPISITTAWVRGKLFGRKDYPAMTQGTDRIGGELWQFEPSQISNVLLVLDKIEGVNQPGEPDLYRREVVTAFSETGDRLGDSHAYLYATDPLNDGFHRITPYPDHPGTKIEWPDIKRSI